MMTIPEELYDFAYCFDFPNELKNLAQMAIPEPWRFLKPQIEGNNTETPILERYIRNIFRHQAIMFNQCMNLQERETYLFLRGGLACMHTGLITPYLEGIYALFESNRKSNVRCGWVFKGFHTASSPKLRCIPRLPGAPRFYMESEGYHPEWEVRINFAHILQDPRNNARLPEKIREARNSPLLLHAAVLYGRALAGMNPMVVAPQVYCGRVQFLLPICLTDMEHCDLALTLTPQNGYYLGHTCLTLEMGYHNARMLARPHAPWLAGLVDERAMNRGFPYESVYGLSIHG